MAHIGEEGRLGACGGLGAIAGSFQLFFALNPVSDVNHKGNTIPIGDAAITDLVVPAIPQAERNVRDDLAIPPVQHSANPFGRRHAANIKNAFLSPKRQDLCVAGAGGNVGQLIEQGKPGAVSHDQRV